MIFKKNWIFLLLLPLSFPLFDFISFHRKCNWLGDGGPDYYGFPFVYRTQIPWVNSFSGEFYILGYLGNVFFYLLLVIVIRKLLRYVLFSDKLKTILRNTSKVIIIVIAILSLFFTYGIEWNIQWKDGRSEFEYTSGKELKCDCKLEFFSIGK